MTNIDRRTFLKGTGALAIGPVVSELNGLAEGSAETKPLPEPARTVAPFEWRAEGVIFSFEFLDNRLRIKSILPAGVAAVDGLPAPTSSSGVEVAIHCTGENADDHHGNRASTEVRLDARDGEDQILLRAERAVSHEQFVQRPHHVLLVRP